MSDAPEAIRLSRFDWVEALAGTGFADPDGAEYYRAFDQGIVIKVQCDRFGILWDRTRRFSYLDRMDVEVWRSCCKSLGPATPAQITDAGVMDILSKFEQVRVNSQVETLRGVTFSLGGVEYFREYDRGTVFKKEEERVWVVWARTGQESWFDDVEFGTRCKILCSVVIMAVITTEAELVKVETRSLGGGVVRQFELPRASRVVDIRQYIREMVACWSSSGHLVDQETRLADHSQLTIGFCNAPT